MQIYNFSNNEERAKLKKLLENHFRKHDLVPFFGLGFTKGCSALNGRVPSEKELKEHLIQIVATIKNYSEDDKKELSEEKLAQVSEYFWQAMDLVPDNSSWTDFFTYVENHFSCVHDLPEEKISSSTVPGDIFIPLIMTMQ